MDLQRLHDEARGRLAGCAALPPVLEGRGLTLEQARRLELGLTEEGDLLLPLRNRAGRLLGLKGRYLWPGRHKYFELPPENGNPPWLAPDLGEAGRAMLWVEGELNGMVTWLALEGQGVGVIGLGSAFDLPHLDLLSTLRVPGFVFLDDDVVGRKSMTRFAAEAERRGVSLRRTAPLLGSWDACEYAGRCGLEALRHRWGQLLGL